MPFHTFRFRSDLSDEACATGAMLDVAELKKERGERDRLGQLETNLADISLTSRPRIIAGAEVTAIKHLD